MQILCEDEENSCGYGYILQSYVVGLYSGGEPGTSYYNIK